MRILRSSGATGHHEQASGHASHDRVHARALPSPSPPPLSSAAPSAPHRRPARRRARARISANRVAVCLPTDQSSAENDVGRMCVPGAAAHWSARLRGLCWRRERRIANAATPQQQQPPRQRRRRRTAAVAAARAAPAAPPRSSSPAPRSPPASLSSTLTATTMAGRRWHQRRERPPPQAVVRLKEKKGRRRGWSASRTPETVTALGIGGRFGDQRTRSSRLRGPRPPLIIPSNCSPPARSRCRLPSRAPPRQASAHRAPVRARHAHAAPPPGAYRRRAGVLRRDEVDPPAHGLPRRVVHRWCAYRAARRAATSPTPVGIMSRATRQRRGRRPPPGRPASGDLPGDRPGLIDGPTRGSVARVTGKPFAFAQVPAGCSARGSRGQPAAGLVDLLISIQGMWERRPT